MVGWNKEVYVVGVCGQDMSLEQTESGEQRRQEPEVGITLIGSPLVTNFYQPGYKNTRSRLGFQNMSI